MDEIKIDIFDVIRRNKKVELSILFVSLAPPYDFS